MVVGLTFSVGTDAGVWLVGVGVAIELLEEVKPSREDVGMDVVELRVSAACRISERENSVQKGPSGAPENAFKPDGSFVSLADSSVAPISSLWATR